MLESLLQNTRIALPTCTCAAGDIADRAASVVQFGAKAHLAATLDTDADNALLPRRLARALGNSIGAPRAEETLLVSSNKNR